jgi:tripartite-type tricarboxylate transporter receptor subunit TctC
MSGVASMSFATMQTVLPLVHSAKVRPIAIFSEKRSSALPDIPTMQEAGLPGFSLNNWIGLFAPAGTPPQIVAKLNAEVREIMQSPETQERLRSEGARFTPYSPEQFAAFQKKEAEVWGPIVKASGASID